MVEALSAAIIPSDESGAGAREARVVDALNRRLAASPSHQELYARGLPGFDALSRRKFGRIFAELAPSEQTDLLRNIDRLAGGDADAPSGAARVVAKALELYWSVRFPAVRLFPVLVDDVMQAFYTDPVSWKWLGYDGPPMPRGYLDLSHPRA
jgi:Gluconate 2-dehydrogenase subunit 3